MSCGDFPTHSYKIPSDGTTPMWALWCVRCGACKGCRGSGRGLKRRNRPGTRYPCSACDGKGYRA